MAQKSETRVFEDMAVTVQQLPATRGVKLSRKLMSVMAPVVGALQGLSLDKDVGALGDAVAKALDQFSEKDLDDLIRTLLETAKVETEGRIAPLMPLFDGLFAGRILLVYKVVAFALEVNFADFLETFRALKANAPAATEGLLKSKA